MRLIYFGSGEFGLPTLRRLHEGHQLVAVVSQPDRPAGRHRQLTPTPIAAWAQSAGLPVLKADDVNRPEFVAQVAALQPDAGVVIAFGQKLGEPLIAACGRLAINLHASLLPRYRGAAPINWAILHGESETGVSVISLASHMDAGLIYAQAATAIEPGETAGELHDRLAALGPELVELVLRELAAGTLRGRPQDETQVSHAPKLTRADAQVSFDASAESVRRRIHGLTPWPGVRVRWWDAATNVERPLILRRVTVEPELTLGAAPGTMIDGHRVAVRDGAVRLLEVQLPGGRPLGIDEFLRGHGLSGGDELRTP